MNTVLRYLIAASLGGLWGFLMVSAFSPYYAFPLIVVGGWMIGWTVAKVTQ